MEKWLKEKLAEIKAAPLGKKIKIILIFLIPIIVVFTVSTFALFFDDGKTIKNDQEGKKPTATGKKNDNGTDKPDEKIAKEVDAKVDDIDKSLE